VKPPSEIALGDGTHLRLFTIEDAPAIAAAVRDSLEHLRPWMPWADESAGDVVFQRERLRRLPELARRGEEWQYGLFRSDESQVLGSFGLMTRRGPGTIEIGYWLHVDAVGHGYATRAVAALTEIALGLDRVKRVLIFCDDENVSSAAIPRRLGYTLVSTTRRAPEAPGDSGRQMMWSRETGSRQTVA
jgi:RimJ/RimL family protein N-acetyltransferase